MKRGTAVSLVALGVAACSAPQRPESHTSPDARTHAASASTRYRRGDYIVYRYAGSYTAQPVTLREEVTEQEGNRLVIEVTFRRGDEVRHWAQHLTDTPENQRNNVIDSLVEIRADGTRVALANRDNADVYRLFEGTFIVPEGRATDVSEHDTTETIAGTTYRCRERAGRNTWHQQQVEFRERECPEFLWTHASAEWRLASAAEGSEPIYRVEVLEAGRLVQSR